MATLLGSLLIKLGLDSGEFKSGLSVSERELKASMKRIERIGKTMTNIGQKLSVAVSAPLAAAGLGIIKASGDYESALGRIQIASEASAAEMKTMSDIALKIGKDSVFGASEAAGAMEMLAKAGIDTSTIIGGAAKAVTDLAAAAGSELDPAASAIADSINQFRLAASDLPKIVNQITGAVNESKFEFSDFTAGMAQGGGVAASAGMSFEDFAATLAATSSQFASGSDAGTSLKTFLLALTPATEKAANAMAEYGLTFFDASGKMKSMAEIAEMLRIAFKDVSDEQRNAALKDIFGTDAIRTAVGLINQGAEGLDRISAKLNDTSAADQAAKRMSGFNGQMDQLKGSIETLAIKIGQSGVLEALTSIVTATAGLVDKMAEADPTLLKIGVTVGVVAAAVGPLLIGLGAIVSACVTLAPAIAAVVGVLGTVSSVIIGGVIPSLAGLIVAMGPILVPLALVAAAVGAVYLAWKNWDKIVQIVDNMVSKVEPLLGGRLASVLRAVLNPIEAVRKGFYHLYDAVVGHSYVPDMVDGIAAEMARLDSVMVDKAEKATAKTKAAFLKLRDDLRPIMARLFPEQAAANKFASDEAAIAAGVKGGAISAATAAEAELRLRRERAGIPLDGPGESVWESIEPLEPAIDKIDQALGTLQVKAEVATVAIAKSFKDMADDTLAALSRLTGAIRGGGFLGVLEAVIGLGLQLGSIGAFGKTIANRINAPKTPASSTTPSTPPILPPIDLPKYAGGTNFHPGGLAIVGERGAELVNMPRGSQVMSNRELRGMGRAGGDTYHIQGNLLTPEFWAQIQSGDQAAAVGGARGAQKLAARRRGRLLVG